MKTIFFSLSFFCLSTTFAQVEKSNHFNLLPAQGDSVKRWNLHFQTTYIYQYKPGFTSPYEGANSLRGAKEHQNSLTMTVYAGARLWKNAALYFNPEIAAGSGLSGALGMAGSTNGETFRVGNPSPALYLARLYLEQTFTIGKASHFEADDANALGGFHANKFAKIYAGKFSLGDIFDNNDYSNSPRTQFLNWSLMNNGAWDYAANVRGYTYALAGKLHLEKTEITAAIAALPNTANGASLNTNLGVSRALNIQVSRSFLLHQRKGNIQLLLYQNVAGMGNYKLATERHDSFMIATRLAGRKRSGICLHYQQEISNNLGLFARFGWNDGKNETWAFTEIDRTATVGLSAAGKAWGRDEDALGIAFAANGISPDHQQFLKQGGRGFMLGDGHLNYAPEMIAEAYYNFRPEQQPIWLTLDYQYVMNPGYNKDRGPLSVWSLRLHVQL